MLLEALKNLTSLNNKVQGFIKTLLYAGQGNVVHYLVKYVV